MADFLLTVKEFVLNHFLLSLLLLSLVFRRKQKHFHGHTRDMIFSTFGKLFSNQIYLHPYPSILHPLPPPPHPSLLARAWGSGGHLVKTEKCFWSIGEQSKDGKESFKLSFAL
tara:strand:+ start:346 stop:684 length:339 start_codon:yes stop_codon:yes gene_type:complete